MRIVERVQKVPGGMMLVPLLLGCIVKTSFPGFLDLGSFTTALFKNGATPLIALLIVATGAQVTVRQSKKVLAKAGVLLLAKTIIPGLLVIAYGRLFGKEGLLGLSLLPKALSQFQEVLIRGNQYVFHGVSPCDWQTRRQSG